MEEYETSSEIVDVEPNCQVFKATHRATGESVLVRKFTSENGTVPLALTREMMIMQKFTKSSHVVNFRRAIRCLEDDDNNNMKLVYYALYEHIGTDLNTFIAAKPLPSDVVKNLLFQILQGVHECHMKGVCHRNINPSDLLVNEKGLRLKIGAGIGHQSCSIHQCLSYQSPEALLGSDRSMAAVDMWAVGCVFAEMVTGEVLFRGRGGDPRNAVKEQLREIFRQLGKPMEDEWQGVTDLPGWESYEEWEGEKKKARLYFSGDLPKDLMVGSVSLEPDGADLLSKMLTFNPAQRITTEAAMEHPYFA